MNEPSLGFAVAPLTPAIGGLVTGIDSARPLSEAVITKLKAAVAERHVLFFAGQTLDSAAHRRFAARFGKLHVHPVYPHVDDLPEITSIETHPGDLPDNDNWHTDVTFIETPPFGAVLTPRTLPSSGGDTLWGSNVAAYQALSAPVRELLDKLTAEHSFETGFPGSRWGIGPRNEKREKAVAANPPVVHPVVRTIEGGQRGLFVNSGSTARILELTEKESDALLAFLFAHLASPSSRSVGVGSLATSPSGTTGSALTTRRSTTCQRFA
jgi:taurine dioxygenase